MKLRECTVDLRGMGTGDGVRPVLEDDELERFEEIRQDGRQCGRIGRMRSASP